MADPDFPTIVVRNYPELVDALARVKNEVLRLSNETVEEISGLCSGHCDKLLGPARAKKIGPRSLGLLLGALGLQLVVRPDPEQVKRVASRWTKRNELRVRRHKRGLWFADPELGQAQRRNGHA